jgi:hypothetical protein
MKLATDIRLVISSILVVEVGLEPLIFEFGVERSATVLPWYNHQILDLTQTWISLL